MTPLDEKRERQRFVILLILTKNLFFFNFESWKTNPNEGTMIILESFSNAAIFTAEYTKTNLAQHMLDGVRNAEKK